LNFLDGAVSLGAALIVWVLVARALGPRRFGVYAIVMAIVMFAYLLIQFGVPPTVRRYVAELDGRGDPQMAGLVAGRGLRIGLVSSVAGAMLLVAGAGPLARFFHQPALQTYVVLGALLLVPMMGIAVLRSLLGGLQQYRFLVAANLVTSPLWVVGCMLSLSLGAGIAGVLVASLAVELTNVVVLWWRSQQLVPIAWGGRLPMSLRYGWCVTTGPSRHWC
jgi:O-antigen/teichoic acid export membrane protein